MPRGKCPHRSSRLHASVVARPLVRSRRLFARCARAPDHGRRDGSCAALAALAFLAEMDLARLQSWSVTIGHIASALQQLNDLTDERDDLSFSSAAEECYEARLLFARLALSHADVRVVADEAMAPLMTKVVANALALRNVRLVEPSLDVVALLATSRASRVWDEVGLWELVACAGVVSGVTVSGVGGEAQDGEAWSRVRARAMELSRHKLAHRPQVSVELGVGR